MGHQRIGGSAWDPSPPRWSRGRAAGPIRRLSAEQMLVMEMGRLQEVAGKRARGLAKLEEINARWERRGRP